MSDRPFNVIFLCTANASRSIMAEAILNKASGFRAFSAGCRPAGAVNPHAIALLQRLNFDTAPLRPKSWHEFTRPGAPEFDFVFTLCDDAAGEQPPDFPGTPMTAHWSIPNPAEAHGTAGEVSVAFNDVFRMLSQRIGIFTALPFDRLDAIALHAKLRDIGGNSGGPAHRHRTSPARPGAASA